jgi:hypothetical protein
MGEISAFPRFGCHPGQVASDLAAVMRPLTRRTKMAGTTYVLHFDATGRTHEDFTVPHGKKVLLVRAPQVEKGTATVTDHLSLKNYVIPNGQTVYTTNIVPGTQVSLAFMARSNNDIKFVNVEMK